MPDPSVVTSAKNSAAAAGTTGVTVTHGFSLVNNDVLYAYAIANDNLGTAWASSSGGTWTELLGQSTAAGNDRRTGVLRRRVTNAAGEPSTYTFTVDSATSLAMAVIVVQVRDGKTSGNPEDATTTGSVGSNDFTPDNVDITTVTNGCLLLPAHMACLDDGSAAKTAGAPSGFTIIDSIKEDTDAGVAFDVWIEVAYKASVAAGAQSIGAWTGTADDATSEFDTYAVAVAPAPPTAPVTSGMHSTASIMVGRRWI